MMIGAVAWVQEHGAAVTEVSVGSGTLYELSV